MLYDNEQGPDVPVTVEDFEEPNSGLSKNDVPIFDIIEEEEWAEDEVPEDNKFYPVLDEATHLATPAIICYLSQGARELLNLYFLSRNNEEASILALGLGNVLVYSVVMAVC